MLNLSFDELCVLEKQIFYFKYNCQRRLKFNFQNAIFSKKMLVL